LERRKEEAMNDVITRCLDTVDELASRAAEEEGVGIKGAHTEGIYRMIMLAVGATALAIGLNGREGEHAVIQGGSRLDIVNQTLERNSVQYRLVELPGGPVN
jgi:hypothetical protein